MYFSIVKYVYACMGICLIYMYVYVYLYVYTALLAKYRNSEILLKYLTTVCNNFRYVKVVLHIEHSSVILICI